MNKAAEIRRLYYRATAATIGRDLARAIELLKSMDTEEERERVAVYMDGLTQMRSEWAMEQRARPRAPGRRRHGAAPDPARKPREP
jgi:hypothetical protein